MRDLQVADLIVEGLDVGLAIAHEDGVVGADFDVVMFEEPGGVAAEFGFGADVGAGTERDPQAVGLAEFHKPANVVASFPVEFAFSGFELIPEDVDADGVEPHRAGFFDAVFPELVRYAGWMDFAGDDFNGLAVDFELAVPRGKLMGFTVVGKRRRRRGDGAAKERSEAETGGYLN